MQLTDLRYYAPAALAEARNLTTTSEAYNFISTRQVLEVLVKDNWQIVDARQNGSRSRDPIFARHEITLSDPRLQMKEVGDVRPQFYLGNSHDGSTAYRMQAGLERLVCKNGMRVPEGLVQAVSIQHRGTRTIDEIVAVAQSYRENVDLISKHIVHFKGTKLSNATTEEFAKRAIALRHDDSVTVDPSYILAIKRYEDGGSDLWNVFNRAQEWLIRGGYPVTRKTEKGDVTRKARAIRSIVENTRINTQLWEVAELFGKN